MSEEKIQVKPERYGFSAVGTEQRVNCNGHRIRYFDHIDHRKYHIHKISLSNYGETHDLFSFELENGEFDNFLELLIRKNPETACTVLQKVVQDKVDSEARILESKANAIHAQLIALGKSRYI